MTAVDGTAHGAAELVQASLGAVDVDTEAQQGVAQDDVEDRELRRALVMHLLTLERTRRRRPGRRGQPPMYRPGR